MDSLYRAFVPEVMATADDFEYSKAVMRYPHAAASFWICRTTAAASP